jgi:hypothetical protein
MSETEAAESRYKDLLSEPIETVCPRVSGLMDGKKRKKNLNKP